MIPIIWHQLQLHQESLCPSRLQEETRRTWRVLMGFLMLDLEEIFTEASEGRSLSSDINSRFIRNNHVLQDSRKRLGGHEESCWGSWCWILKKFSQKLLKEDPYHLTSTPGSSGTIMSFKTPRRDLEDRCSFDRVHDVGSSEGRWNTFRSFWCWNLVTVALNE